MVLSGEHPASEMVGVLRQLSLLVTSRYHAAVLSMAAEIPIAAVSMDERLDGLLRELSMEKDYLFSVSDPHLGQHLTRAMEQGWAERSAIARHIHVQYQEYLERLSRMGAFLKKYITGRLP